MKCTRYLKLIALCLSDGGVAISSGTKYIHFTNKSEILLELFKKEIRKFSEAKIHRQQKPRGITLRVFDKNLVNELSKISPNFRTRPMRKISETMKEREKIRIDKLWWPIVNLPDSLFTSRKDKTEFLRIYASCDGYPSIFPRKDSWSAVERIVAIVCHHPQLKQRLSELLTDVDVTHTVKKFSLEMRSKKAISEFNEKIGFLDGVKMTGNSKYWEGSTKNDILRKILKSYSMKFESRNSNFIIDKLKII